MSITIRQAGPGDEAAAVRLVRELAAATDYGSDVDDHAVRHFLVDPSTGILLALDGGATVGLLSYATVPSLFHAGDSGEIEMLVVSEDRRGEGIGRQLLGAALRLLEEAGCVEVSISTEADNEIAQKLYFDLGLTDASVLLEKHIRR